MTSPCCRALRSPPSSPPMKKGASPSAAGGGVAASRGRIPKAAILSGPKERKELIPSHRSITLPRRPGGFHRQRSSQVSLPLAKSQRVGLLFRAGKNTLCREIPSSGGPCHEKAESLHPSAVCGGRCCRGMEGILAFGQYLDRQTHGGRGGPGGG